MVRGEGLICYSEPNDERGRDRRGERDWPVLAHQMVSGMGERGEGWERT